MSCILLRVALCVGGAQGVLLQLASKRDGGIPEDGPPGTSSSAGGSKQHGHEAEGGGIRLHRRSSLLEQERRGQRRTDGVMDRQDSKDRSTRPEHHTTSSALHSPMRPPQRDILHRRRSSLFLQPGLINTDAEQVEPHNIEGDPDRGSNTNPLSITPAPASLSSRPRRGYLSLALLQKTRRKSRPSRQQNRSSSTSWTRNKSTQQEEGTAPAAASSSTFLAHGPAGEPGSDDVGSEPRSPTASGGLHSLLQKKSVVQPRRVYKRSATKKVSAADTPQSSSTSDVVHQPAEIILQDRRSSSTDKVALQEQEVERGPATAAVLLTLSGSRSSVSRDKTGERTKADKDKQGGVPLMVVDELAEDNLPPGPNPVAYHLDAVDRVCGFGEVHVEPTKPNPREKKKVPATWAEDPFLRRCLKICTDMKNGCQHVGMFEAKSAQHRFCRQFATCENMQTGKDYVAVWESVHEALHKLHAKNSAATFGKGAQAVAAQARLDPTSIASVPPDAIRYPDQVFIDTLMHDFLVEKHPVARTFLWKKVGSSLSGEAKELYNKKLKGFKGGAYPAGDEEIKSWGRVGQFTLVTLLRSASEADAERTPGEKWQWTKTSLSEDEFKVAPRPSPASSTDTTPGSGAEGKKPQRADVEYHLTGVGDGDETITDDAANPQQERDKKPSCSCRVAMIVLGGIGGLLVVALVVHTIYQYNMQEDAEGGARISNASAGDDPGLSTIAAEGAYDVESSFTPVDSEAEAGGKTHGGSKKGEEADASKSEKGGNAGSSAPVTRSQIPDLMFFESTDRPSNKSKRKAGAKKRAGSKRRLLSSKMPSKGAASSGPPSSRVPSRGASSGPPSSRVSSKLASAQKSLASK